MALPLQDYTLSFSPKSNGWPSFYSFIPEYIVGMNQYLYTFKKGNIYRHNTNSIRNKFYGELSVEGTTITTIFNADSLSSKVFKTIELEGTDSWEVTASSDIQGDRTMDVGWFEKKEGDWFAFIRGLTGTTDNLSLRSANGIGSVSTVDSTDPALTTLTFPVGFQVGSIISIGDMIYATTSVVQAGEVVAPLDPLGNVVTIDTVDPVGSSIPIDGEFILYVKNQIAESHGILGHYCVMKFKNILTTSTEMVAVKSDVMKSYP